MNYIHWTVNVSTEERKGRHFFVSTRTSNDSVSKFIFWKSAYLFRANNETSAQLWLRSGLYLPSYQVQCSLLHRPPSPDQANRSLQNIHDPLQKSSRSLQESCVQDREHVNINNASILKTARPTDWWRKTDGGMYTELRWTVGWMDGLRDRKNDRYRIKQ